LPSSSHGGSSSKTLLSAGASTGQREDEPLPALLRRTGSTTRCAGSPQRPAQGAQCEYRITESRTWGRQLGPDDFDQKFRYQRPMDGRVPPPSTLTCFCVLAGTATSLARA
jgi:hypothetical protein